MPFEEAILRQCGRCKAWRQVDRDYKPSAVLCISCGSSWSQYVPNKELGLKTLSRAIAITDKGKVLLRQWRRQELLEANLRKMGA